MHVKSAAVSVPSSDASDAPCKKSIATEISSVARYLSRVFFQPFGLQCVCLVKQVGTESDVNNSEFFSNYFLQYP